MQGFREGLHAEAHGRRGRLGLAAAGVGTLLRGLNCLRENLGQRAQIGGRRHVLLLLRRLQLLLERVERVGPERQDVQAPAQRTPSVYQSAVQGRGCGASGPWHGRRGTAGAAR